MKDCTVIIPIIEFGNDDLIKYAQSAYKSIPKDFQVLIVGTPEAIDSFGMNEKNITPVICEGDNSYSNQVNVALEHVTTKYFSVLEFDDEYSKTWFSNVEEHIKSLGEDIFGFFPLTELIDYENKQPIGYANEAFLASSFSEKIGYMDLESLMDYFGFNTSGAVFKTEEFKKLGGLKASMKLTFWYEFLLRALYKDKHIYVIPKVGCFHLVNRPGSLTDKYNEEMSSDEADWWVDLAKKEYYFTNDRKKVYEK